MGEEVIAVKALLLVELVVGEGGRFSALGVEAGDFFLEAGFAEVGELAVEFVLAGVDGGRGVGGKVGGEKLLDVGAPGGARIGW